MLRIKIIPDCGATGSLPKRNSSRMARSTVELARFVSEDNQLRRSLVWSLFGTKGFSLLYYLVTLSFLKKKKKKKRRVCKFQTSYTNIDSFRNSALIMQTKWKVVLTSSGSSWIGKSSNKTIFIRKAIRLSHELVADLHLRK